MSQLPIGWRTVPLVNTCKLFTDGNWVESKDQSLDGVRLVQTGNVGKGDFKDRREKARWISEETFDRLKCQEIFPGDCLVSRLPDPVGRSCIIPDTGDKMITAVDCSILRFDPSILLPEYFNYFSQSRNYLSDVESRCSGATRKRISRKNLGVVEVPLPLILEQKRIVAILDETFAGISQAVANAEKNLANARELFESYLNNVFTQKGDGWVESILSESCDVRDGTHDSPKYVDAGIPFITQKNIRDDGLNFDKIKFISDLDHEKFYKRSNVYEDDILISMIGVNRGMACLVDDGRIFSIKNVGLIKANDSINMRFLLYYLKSKEAKNYIEVESRGGAQPFIGLTKLRNFPISLAPIDDQELVVIKLDELYLQTKQLEIVYQKKLTALTELKQSILQKAFIGELTTDTVLQQANG